MKTEKNHISPNPSDFVFWASEDVFPSMTMMVTLRFGKRHDAADIRAGMRRLLSVFPRLRSRVVPGVLSCRIEILADNDAKTNRLFDDAFSVRQGLTSDSDEYDEFRREQLNRPFPLKDSLPVRMIYLPDGDTPTLMAFIHHMACDGLSFHRIVDTLMAILNGKDVEDSPVDDPSLIPAIVEKPFYRIPFQFYRSLKTYRSIASGKKRCTVIHSSRHPSNRFGTVNLYRRVLSHDVESIKRVSAALKCSITVLIVAALTRVLIRRDQENRTGDTVGIFHAIDLRPLFPDPPRVGNYALFSKLNIRKEFWQELPSMIGEINRQWKENVERYRQREMLVFYLLDVFLPTVFGRKLLARMIEKTRLNKGRMINGTCFVSTGGSLDRFNTHGNAATVIEFVDSATINHLFVAITSLGGKVSTNITYPEDDFSSEEIREIARSLDDTLGEILGGFSSHP